MKQLLRLTVVPATQTRPEAGRRFLSTNRNDGLRGCWHSALDWGFVLALLRLCNECTDWGDNGDIYDFTGFYHSSFVIYTCMLDVNDCYYAEVQVVFLQNK